MSLACRQTTWISFVNSPRSSMDEHPSSNRADAGSSPAGDAITWTYERALGEAKQYAAEDYNSAWVFQLADGSYGWANCHPSWGWLLKGEKMVSCVHSNGVVGKFRMEDHGG